MHVHYVQINLYKSQKSHRCNAHKHTRWCYGAMLPSVYTMLCVTEFAVCVHYSTKWLT